MRLVRRSPRDAAFVAGAGLATFLLFLVVRNSLVDDAYITLDYARNLAGHLHWGLTSSDVSNTATSPLNVVLLAAAGLPTRLAGGGVHEVFAAGVVSAALAMLMAWSWLRIVRALGLPLVAAVVGIALVLLNPILLSSVGLEVLLVPALLTTLVAVALEERAGWFGAVAGLALLARLDLVVFVVLIGAASPAIRRGWRRALAALALVAGPWFVFSWLYFGSAVPDTLVIKTAQRHIWGKWSFFDGPVMYSQNSPGRRQAILLAFAPAALGAVALAVGLAARRGWLRPIGPVAGLGVAGLAYYAVLAALDPGPFHWYYVAPTTALAIFLAIVLGRWLVEARGRAGRLAAVPALALGAAGLLALGALAKDLGHGIPWRSPVISTNFAVASDYKRVGTDLRRRVGPATVGSFGEIGTLAYYCGCRIMDVYSHRGYLVPVVDDRIDKAGPLLRQLLQLNYEWLDRDAKPPHLDYRLGYGRGPGSGGDWQVWSNWVGPGHIKLVPAQ